MGLLRSSKARNGKKTVAEFFDTINEVSVYMNKMELPLEYLNQYLTNQYVQAGSIQNEIRELKKNKVQMLEYIGITQSILNQYMNDRPLIEKVNHLRKELEKLTMERDNLDYELAKVTLENVRINLKQSVQEREIELVNEQLLEQGGRNA